MENAWEEPMRKGWTDCYEQACRAHCDESGKRSRVILRPARCICE